ncbi:MAG TPA: hypothetical protein VMZ26_10420 [Pyrinomonadaceae bacterium]|nr:hypothetical protein [Pyrinomonadaceae bacterium]
MRLFSIFLCILLLGLLFGQIAEASASSRADRSKRIITRQRAISALADSPPAGNGQTGIKEVIPSNARERFQSWKNELLSTHFGREQWNSYAARTDFLLTIVVTGDRKHGAGTDDFEWDDKGNLIAATITLGKNIDKGFPDPVYYPVMNSLANYNGLYEIDGDILASTKIIHEIGHVNFTAETNAKVFQLQNKLMSSYNSIFLRNGYNTSDPRLVALADELGAKPIEIWEEREYRSEVSAMRYLVERMGNESFSCSLFSRMRRNIADYARNYRDKFDAIVTSGQINCRD